MEPTRILMAIQPPDLIKELMRARQNQIAKLYPQFKEEFYQMQRKLKEHAEMLKNRKEEGSQELNRHVIEQLELKDYKLLRPSAKFSIKCNKPSRGLLRKNEETFPVPREEQSRRSSEVSETGFRPYQISNFKKTLQSYKISYNETIRDSVDK